MSLSFINVWSHSNKMRSHPSKCKALSVTNQRNILYNLPCTIFNYKLGPVLINYVHSQVTVTSKHLWTDQCDKLAKNANSKRALLMRTMYMPFLNQ